jgi:flagellar biosynthesis activator protein FlaF
MLSSRHASQAYKSAARFRSQRDQEAEVFFHASAGLCRARDNKSLVHQTRALSDNRRLWAMVTDLMRDPNNQLPLPLRASIISVGLSVQREMDRDHPDLDFLIYVNEHVASGLASQPLSGP